MVGKIRSRKADQAAKPGIATVHGHMSVAINWANKKQLAKCVYMVSFPISSHKYYTGHTKATVFELENFIQPYTGTDFTFLLVKRRT